MYLFTIFKQNQYIVYFIFKDNIYNMQIRFGYNFRFLTLKISSVIKSELILIFQVFAVGSKFYIFSSVQF